MNGFCIYMTVSEFALPLYSPLNLELVRRRGVVYWRGLKPLLTTAFTEELEIPNDRVNLGYFWFTNFDFERPYLYLKFKDEYLEIYSGPNS